jgi:hypothetical protein
MVIIITVTMFLWFASNSCSWVSTLPEVLNHWSQIH